jgi:YidC/Oxa1 family membrane protein insertase
VDRNFLLAFGLSLLVITLWMSLQPRPQPQDGETTTPPVAEQPGAPPPEPGGEATDIPGWETTLPAQRPEGGFPDAAPIVPGPEGAAAGRTVLVETDLFQAELTSRGGALTKFELKQYDDASLPGRPPVHLVTNAPDLPPALATPFRELGVGTWGTAEFEVSRSGRHQVVFTRTHDGVTLRKTYRFEDGRYDFTLLLELENGTGRVLEPIYETIWPAVRQ